jgi:Purple acid Phosphatase, N-terminal domain
MTRSILAFIVLVGSFALVHAQSQDQPGAESLSATRTASGGNVRLLAGPIVQNLTDTSASIFWIASGEMPANLRYGFDPDNLDHTADPRDPNPNAPRNFRQYRAELTNLRPGKSYYFEIASRDRHVSQTGSFQTEPSNYAEGNRVIITDGPQIEYLDSTSAEIAWSTNLGSSTLVRYGEDPNALVKTEQAPWGRETHRVRIKNLQPNTTYYFVVESSEAQGTGTMAKSAEAQISTPSERERALKHIVPAQR